MYQPPPGAMYHHVMKASWEQAAVYLLQARLHQGERPVPLIVCAQTAHQEHPVYLSRHRDARVFCHEQAVSVVRLDCL